MTEPILVKGYKCPQCDMDAEIYLMPDGKVLCQVCGWILKYPEPGTEIRNGIRLPIED